MNKIEYLNKLEKALENAQVCERDEILAEYSVHFDMKTADGYSEEETAARLAAPEELAAQFADFGTTACVKKKKNVLTCVLLAITDFFSGIFAAFLCAWVIIFGAFTLCAAAAGVFVVSGTDFGRITPEMPFICGLFIGISLLALAALSALGTEYCRLFAAHLINVYRRFRSKLSGKNGRTSPPASLHPHIKPKKRRIIRTIALISLAVFAVCFIAGYASMVIAARSFEPWHVWHWFV